MLFFGANEHTNLFNVLFQLRFCANSETTHLLIEIGSW